MFVDVRPLAHFAAGHVPRALPIPLRPVFATWLGWLAPSDRPIVIIRDNEQDLSEIVWQAAKIGYDNLVGELACGIHAWTSAGYEIARTRMVLPDQVDGLRVLDIRQTPEFVAGRLPGAVHIEATSPPAPMISGASRRS